MSSFCFRLFRSNVLIKFVIFDKYSFSFVSSSARSVLSFFVFRFVVSELGGLVLRFGAGVKVRRSYAWRRGVKVRDWC